MSGDEPPNFYVSYEKLKKIAEDLRVGSLDHTLANCSHTG